MKVGQSLQRSFSEASLSTVEPCIIAIEKYEENLNLVDYTYHIIFLIRFNAKLRLGEVQKEEYQAGLGTLEKKQVQIRKNT